MNSSTIQEKKFSLKPHISTASIIYLLLICIPLFQNLGSQPLQLWDESRNANNAIEMYENGEYMVRHYKGSPDMWEVKPPLLIWMQTLSLKIFGLNEWSVRLPSAIAGLLLLLFIPLFISRLTGYKYAGYLVGLILVSSQGYIGHHVTRTGDHDSLLVLFMIISLFSFYKYISVQEMPAKYLFIGTIFLIASTYTKSVVALMYIPGLMIFSIYKRKLVSIVRSPYFLLAVLLYAATISFYYLHRESASPGYLKAVWNEELFHRYTNKKESFWFYTKLFNSSRFTPWIFLLGPSIWLCFKYSSKAVKDFLVLILACATSYFIIISSGSKNAWYDALLYPLFSIFIGYSLYLVIFTININKWIKTSVISLYSLSWLFAYSSIIHRDITISSKHSDIETYGIAYFLREEIDAGRYGENYCVYYDSYDAHLLFYTTAYRLKRGNISLTNRLPKFEKGKIIIASRSQDIAHLQNAYNGEFLNRAEYAKCFKLTSIKE